METNGNPRDIQNRMMEVRRELEETAAEIAAKARDLTQRLGDWRYYLHQHPWAVAAVAAAVGYLIVPRRAPQVFQLDREALMALAQQCKLPASATKPRPVQMLLGAAVSQLATALARPASEYLTRKLGRL